MHCDADLVVVDGLPRKRVLRVVTFSNARKRVQCGAANLHQPYANQVYANPTLALRQSLQAKGS